MPNDMAIVSAADSKFFDLLQGLIRSIRDKPEGRGCPLCILDLGLEAWQREWLLCQGAALRFPYPPLFISGMPNYARLFLARPLLPQIFPGYDVYLWIDADAWVQDWSAIAQYRDLARQHGFAIALEADPAYGREKVFHAHAHSYNMFGPDALATLATLERLGPMNAGVFAGRADAPHWNAWHDNIREYMPRAVSDDLFFMLDQTALSLVCRRQDLPSVLLPSVSNWIAHFAPPMVTDDGTTLIRPLPPHEKIGIVHQTADTKRAFLALPRQGGGMLTRSIAYEAPSQLPDGDYVSPGLQVVRLDACFPYVGTGDPKAWAWPWLRRDVPHRWLVDTRIPSVGLLNRDEISILYNLALGFHGKRALEIGVLTGWATCHLALAGVDLDSIDPLLDQQAIRDSVVDSLRLAHPAAHLINLVAGRSPEAVHALAQMKPGGWSLFLIDGDHEGAAPLNDTMACLPHAAADCAMVFHDLASPDVTRAVMYLKAQGWRVRVYHTTQIMAVAWRGDVSPVAHQPDPRVHWRIPQHVLPLLDV